MLHDAGNLRTAVANLGMIGSAPGSNLPWADLPSVEWPKGSGVDYLWVAGFWIGAIQAGVPHVTTTAYEIEVRPGPADSMYASYEGAPGGARAPSPDADDDHDGRVDEDRLNGRDDDGDGLVDEDFAAVSDQMLFCEYADTAAVIPATLPEHHPLGLHVEQSTRVWRDSRIADLVGIDLLVVNTGLEALDRVCVGLFADCDLGPGGLGPISEDDRAGFWEGSVDAELGGPVRSVKVSVGYMFDDDGDLGTTPGYIGWVFLGSRGRQVEPQGPLELSNFRMFHGNSAFPTGDPANDEERYRALSGDDPLGLPPPDSTTGFRPPLLSGTGDYRIFLATAGSPAVAGAVSLGPGDSLDVDFAMVMGRGFDAMLRNAARAQLLYDNDWRPEGPMAIDVQDLVASASARGIELEWRLAPSAVREIRAVRVQRAGAEAGPYADRVELAAQPAMRYMDRDVASDGTYWYRLALDLAAGGTQWTGAIQVWVAGGGPGGIEAANVRADGAVEIRYRVAAAAPLELAAFDARGRLVRVLERRPAPPGSYVRLWDRRGDSGIRLARGVYFLRLDTARGVSTRKLVLSRD